MFSCRLSTLLLAHSSKRTYSSVFVLFKLCIQSMIFNVDFCQKLSNQGIRLKVNFFSLVWEADVSQSPSGAEKEKVVIGTRRMPFWGENNGISRF